VKSAELKLSIKAAFPDQEFITIIAKPSFWEGRMIITGTLRGPPVQGLGFLERHGFNDGGMSSMDVFFKRMSGVVLREIESLIPCEPTREQACDLALTKELDRFLPDVDVSVLARKMLQPLRRIIDRGGKAWRSYALLLCCDAVGGSSERFRAALAMPEIMHVGSLIIDDIQDKSDTRRGGPTCHKMYGEPVAINSGTSGYFIAIQALSKCVNVTDVQRARIYETYFDTLRAAHVGQAMDVHGQDEMMEECIENGDSQALVRRVICTHRLKSAVPAGNLARMGALIGGGTEQQMSCLGLYFESVGVAFQIIDDVINLRGFPGNTKRRGEDICAGKITFPVAMGMGRLSKSHRRRIWDIIRSKPQDQTVVEQVCDQLETCGAISACVDAARTMVDQAWTNLKAVLPDTYYSVRIRAFGLYVLDRHY